MKKLIVLAITIVTLLAIALPAMAEYNTTMYVTCPSGEFVRMRASANTSSDTVIKLHNGDMVKADYYNSTWHKVKYTSSSGRTYKGYMMSQFLTQDTPSTPTPTPTPSYNWTTRYGEENYEKGDEHNLFANVQRDLNRFFETYTEYWGGEYHNLTNYAVYPLAIDGIYGNASEVAVYTFQQKMNLSQDGIVGPDTKTALYNWCQNH